MANIASFKSPPGQSNSPPKGLVGSKTVCVETRKMYASPAASYRYLHAVDGRDAEIASALSELAAHGDAAKLPRSIVARHL